MAKARTELIHCDQCGEDYAATYRRCPFCNAKRPRIPEGESEPYEQPYYGEDDYDYEAPRRRGGKRLAEEDRRGGDGGGHPVRTALYILSALVILLAIVIMCSMVIPRILDLAPAPSADAQTSVSPSPAAPASPVPSQPAVPSAEADPSFAPLPVVDDPLALDSPDLPPVENVPSTAPSTTPSAAPSPVSSPAPSAGLHLSSTDFTLSPRYPTYQLETGIGRALVTYSVKDESVATVSSTGLVTAVGDGRTTLTVTDQSGNTAACIVRVSGITAQTQASQAPASKAPASETPAGQAPASETPADQARLNRTEFSISEQYPDPYRLRVRDGEAASWSSSKESVATVSENGTVTAVGNGTAKIRCTLTDGTVLTCTVHVSGK